MMLCSVKGGVVRSSAEGSKDACLERDSQPPGFVAEAMLSGVKRERRGEIGLDRVSNEASSGVGVLKESPLSNQHTSVGGKRATSDVRGRA